MHTYIYIYIYIYKCIYIYICLYIYIYTYIGNERKAAERQIQLNITKKHNLKLKNEIINIEKKATMKHTDFIGMYIYKNLCARICEYVYICTFLIFIYICIQAYNKLYFNVDHSFKVDMTKIEYLYIYIYR
jgi:hypothetical protein